MDPTDTMTAMLRLQPGSAAAACTISHLSKHDKQQFSLSCKHARLLAVAAVMQLNLGHKWYSATCSSKPGNSNSSSSGSAASSGSGSSSSSGSSSLSSSGYNSRTSFPHCTCVAVRPRTMDELSNMTSALLLHKVKQLPALSDLRLDLQGVYDKHCDLSLILKSIRLHAPQLASLSLQQAAMLTAKSVAALADMPQLSSLTLKNAHGFEPGALAKLAGISNLAHLHLELLETGSTAAAGSTTGSTVQISAAAGSSAVLTPSELARLQASDEVGLAKCTRLVSLTAVNLARAGALHPVEALLGAIAGSLKPRLATLVLANMPELPASVIEVATGIPSLCHVSLAGCDVAGSADVAKLSVLTGLVRLELAPQLPPAAALAAVAKGCKRLASISTGAAQLGPGAAVMSGVEELQLLAVSPVGAAAASAAAHAGPDSGNAISSSLAAVSLRVRPPLQLTGLSRVWPGLRALEISGWGLDAAGVAAIRQLEGLNSLKLVGGCQAGAALQGKLLLPLLEMPELQQLVLLEITDLTDDWIADAMRGVGAAGGGSFCAVQELTLGAVASGAAGDGAAGAGTSTGGKGTPVSTAAAPAAGCVGDGSQMVTDRGLVRLFACPRLRKLTLVQLLGITLAAVKALARGSSTLAAVEALRCPAISAAPPEAPARAAVVAPDRAIDLRVSP